MCSPDHFVLPESLLPRRRRSELRALLLDRPLAVCFGAGVDSTAMLILLRACGLIPTLITFADTGGEKPETLDHLQRVRDLMQRWGWPDIVRCVKRTLAATKYRDLYGNCMANETLPSLAFGLKSCSLKWKVAPQDLYIMGATRGPSKQAPHPAWRTYLAGGPRIVKLIGYDSGLPDRRRSAKLATADENFDYVYPLQTVGWSRQECVEAITASLGRDWIPIKSACFYCPASRPWELFWLAANHPALLDAALLLERRALTGRHSRFPETELGVSWESLVSGADSFPTLTITVGLGRSFAWNQWARINDVVDDSFHTKRDGASVARFLQQSEQLRSRDNALDIRFDSAPARSAKTKPIPIRPIDCQ